MKTFVRIDEASYSAYTHLIDETPTMSVPSKHTLYASMQEAVDALIYNFTAKLRIASPDDLFIVSGVWVYPELLIDPEVVLDQHVIEHELRSINSSLTKEILRTGLQPVFGVGSYMYQGTTVDPYIGNAVCIMLYKRRSDDVKAQNVIAGFVEHRFAAALMDSGKKSVKYRHPKMDPRTGSRSVELTPAAYDKTAEIIQDRLQSNGHTVHVEYSRSSRAFVCNQSPNPAK